MLTQLTQPAVSAVTLQEAKTYGRIDHADADGELVGRLLSSQEAIEEAIGRRLINQQWQLTLLAFTDHIYLPLPPCQSVDSIVYRDAAGTSQTLAADAYDAVGLDSVSKAMIMPALGATWPDTAPASNAVQITFTCGYGESWNDVPEPLREAIIDHAVANYDHMRGRYFDGVLNSYKVWDF